MVTSVLTSMVSGIAHELAETACNSHTTSDLTAWNNEDWY
jgi:hypothetical protein